MADFVVSTVFKSKDEMSQAFRKMGLSADKFSNKTIRSFGRIAQKALSVKTIVGGMLGAAVVQRGFGLMQQGVREVATEFLDFEDSLTAASAKFGVFDRSSDTFKALSATAREVGAATEFTSAQAAEGLRFLAKAGWDAISAMKALPSFVDLATASEMDFARAADIATDVMGAFRLQSKDANENLKQLTRVNDVLSKAVNMANVDMEDLFETIKFAGPIAKTAGVSLEQFSAMAAFIGGAGIKGSLGGTALRTMFLNLVAPTDKIKGKLAEFNTEIKNVDQIKNNRKALEKLLKVQLESGGKLKNPIEILKGLNAGMAKLSETEKAAALNMIFGKRAVSGAAVAMDGASGALQKFETALNKSNGNAAKLAAFMRTSLSKRFDALKSAAIELGFKFIDAFEKKLPGGIDAATKAIREFNVRAFLDKLDRVFDKALKVYDTLSRYKGLLVGLGVAFAAVKIGSFVSGIVSLGVALKGAAAAGGFSGLVGGAGVLIGVAPIVLAIAAAVGGLSAGIYTLVTNWDDLKIAMGWFIEDIPGILADHARGWANLAGIIGGGVVSALKWVGETASTAGDSWRYIGKEVLSFHDKTWSSFTDMLLGTMREVPNALSKVWDAISSGAISALGRVLDLIKKVGSGIAALPSALISLGGKLFSSEESSPRVPEPAAAPRAESARRAEQQQQAQNISFNGRIDVAGPPGTKVSGSTKGAPPVQMSLLGAGA